MSQRLYLSLLAVGFACLVALAAFSGGVTVAGANDPPPIGNATNAPDEATRALVEGTSLLRRNRSDLALPLLESALKLFTQANNRSGLAAAHDALGDIYLRHGQYDTAVEHFGRAAEAFRAQSETANAALMFAKLGETYYLAGDEPAARAAFARIGEGGKKSSATTGAALNAGAQTNGSNNNNSSSGGGAGRLLTFASISALLPASCSALSSPQNSAQSSPVNNAVDNVASNIAPNNPPARPSNNPASNSSGNPSNNAPRNMGRAPKKLDDLGRMDLRVFDEQGNPVKGAKARLSTTRPNGIACDCWEVTNASGRAVLPPLHIGKVLKLEVNAPGFKPLEQIVPAEQLAEPFKVTLQSKNAATSASPKPGQKFAHAVLVPQPATRSAAQLATNAANALSASVSLQSSGACFDFYRLFNAYATSELTLARADFDNNRLDSAQAHYRNVLAAADTNSQAGNLGAARLFRAVSRTSLGDIALRQSRFADALKFYNQAVEIARQDGRAELTWSAERGLGKTYWVMAAVAADDNAASKNRNDALKHYRAALGIIETLFAGSLRADDARSNFLATTKDVFDEASGALAEMALMNAPASPAPASRNRSSAHATTGASPLAGQSLTYAAEAFRIVEQGKARSLLDMLGDARAEVREGVPAALLARKTANMARQQEIAYLLGGVGLRGNAPPQNVAELEAELERLTGEFNSLENGIRTSSPRYAALMRTQPLTLAEVQRQVLDDSTALLEYNLGTHQSYLFAATKTGLTVYRLPSRAQIERQAIELRQQLVPAGVRRAIAGINVESTTRGLTLGGPSTASANVSAYVAAAHALYNTVVAPAIASIGDRRLLVVPEGALNYVPFESLVTNRQGADYSTLAYLIKTNEVVYAPSASVVAVLRQAARREGAGSAAGMLLVADPVFDASDERLKNSTLAGATKAGAAMQRMSLASALADVTNLKSPNLKLVRLDGTRSEAEEIAKLARANGGRADVWLDFDANEANLHEHRLDNYRVLHFATHGLLDSERPQFTGLALSLVGQTGADGYLRTDEVFNLRLGSPLVMLSACETGLGRERRGEGVIGLTRAFMYAGAPTVGVSLWSVGDKSTAELMPEFYRRLLAGGGSAPSAAMRASQLSMIAGKKYSAPYFWSPFILVGDWR